MAQRPRDGVPGRVLLVVVPALPPGTALDATEAPLLDAATLARISAHLLARAAPGARLLVRNAAYERIQVRCALQLRRSVHAGDCLRAVNQALREHLSPWRPGGLTANFDWQLGTDEVEAFLRGQHGVEAVGQVSLLHIVRSDAGDYRLSDSALGLNRPAGPADPSNAQGSRRTIRPTHRWSLAVPMRQHLLALDDQPAAQGPQVTGLARLTLGSNFIIGGRAP